MPAKVKDSFTAREIAESVNNSLAMARRPATFDASISDLKRQKLREYSIAITEPLREVLAEEDPLILRPEEAVVILLSAALMIQMECKLSTDKVPMSAFAKSLSGEPLV